jgi:hypothetical protein
MCRSPTAANYEDSASSPNSFHDKRSCLQTEHARARTDSQAEMLGALCSRGVTERIIEILGYNSITKVRACVQFDLSFRKGLHPGRMILLRCLCIRKINQSDPIPSQFPSLDKPSERLRASRESHLISRRERHGIPFSSRGHNVRAMALIGPTVHSLNSSTSRFSSAVMGPAHSIVLAMVNPPPTAAIFHSLSPLWQSITMEIGLCPFTSFETRAYNPASGIDHNRRKRLAAIYLADCGS